MLSGVDADDLFGPTASEFVRAHARKGARGVVAHIRRVHAYRQVGGVTWVQFDGDFDNGDPWHLEGNANSDHVKELWARAVREHARFA